MKLDILRRLGLGPASAILDVGCGTGQLAVTLAGFLEDTGRYVGTDIGREGIEFCRARYTRPNFRFVHQPDPTRLPLAEDRFDVVAFFGVFTHTYPDETAALLAEARRLLAPGGLIYADTFLSDAVADFAGNRGGVELNPARFAELAAAAGLAAAEADATPWGRYSRRVWFRLTAGPAVRGTGG